MKATWLSTKEPSKILLYCGITVAHTLPPYYVSPCFTELEGLTHANQLHDDKVYKP